MKKKKTFSGNLCTIITAVSASEIRFYEEPNRSSKRIDLRPIVIQRVDEYTVPHMRAPPPPHTHTHI